MRQCNESGSGRKRHLWPTEVKQWDKVRCVRCDAYKHQVVVPEGKHFWDKPPKYLFCCDQRFKRAKVLALRALLRGIDERTVSEKYRISPLAISKWKSCDVLGKFQREELWWQKQNAAYQAKLDNARANYEQVWLSNLRSVRGTAKHFHVSTKYIYQWLKEDGYDIWKPEDRFSPEELEEAKWKEAARTLKQIRKALRDMQHGRKPTMDLSANA